MRWKFQRDGPRPGRLVASGESCGITAAKELYKLRDDDGVGDLDGHAVLRARVCQECADAVIEAEGDLKLALDVVGGNCAPRFVGRDGLRGASDADAEF